MTDAPTDHGPVGHLFLCVPTRPVVSAADGLPIAALNTAIVRAQGHVQGPRIDRRIHVANTAIDQEHLKPGGRERGQLRWQAVSQGRVYLDRAIDQVLSSEGISVPGQIGAMRLSWVGNTSTLCHSRGNPISRDKPDVSRVVLSHWSSVLTILTPDPLHI